MWKIFGRAQKIRMKILETRNPREECNKQSNLYYLHILFYLLIWYNTIEFSLICSYYIPTYHWTNYHWAISNNTIKWRAQVMVHWKSRNSLTLSNFHMQHNLYYYCYSYVVVVVLNVSAGLLPVLFFVRLQKAFYMLEKITTLLKRIIQKFTNTKFLILWNLLIQYRMIIKSSILIQWWL